MKASQSYGSFKWLWGWVEDQIVQDVPKDIAVCEFDCQKDQCTWGEWETCERRLRKPASASAQPDDDAREEKTKNGTYGP